MPPRSRPPISFFTAATSVFLGLLLLLASGCGKKDPASAASAASAGTKPLQIWRVGNGAEPQDLDPHGTVGVSEHNIEMALFESLVSEDPKNLDPLPGVALSWDISADGLVYTFHLRPDAKWSNGESLTADDCVQTYRRILSPTLASEYAYLVYDYVAGAKEYYDGKLKDFSEVGFKALDPHTLRVTLKNPTPYLLKLIAHHPAWTPLPVKTIARFGPIDQKHSPWTRPGNLVGNGPFVLKEWTPNRKIVVVRNPFYWDAATVKLDAIEFYPIDDVSTEERMFRTGQLDLTYEMPSAKIDTYRKEYPESLRIDPYLGIYFYRCNVLRPPLNDKRVRQALALAFDRESIVKNVARGDQQPAYAVSYPGNSGYTPAARLTGGVAEARRLLAEAGYPGGKGLPPLELLYNTNENHRLIGEAIQAMWRTNLGVEVRLVNQEWRVYLDMQHTKDYMLARAGWIADYLDPNFFLQTWVTDSGNNDTNWSNPEYDRLYAAALAAKSDAERYAIYQKMDAILVDEVPIIPIYYYTRVHAVSPKVKGYYPTLLDTHPYKYIWLEN
jgi:oligopeptide transport system substrate-binding protein